MLKGDKMLSYEGFSKVYDKFMEDIPYDEWVTQIENIWDKYKLTPKIVLDLACGTGNITINLAKKGYDMIGIDLSESMLLKANEKAENQKLKNILFLNQDMREFELYGTVDSIICLCDSMNYILEEEELIEVFKLVNNYLEPGGLFIFDINTIYKFENILGLNSFCETTENSAYTWENYYDANEMINEFYMNFFIKNEDGLYERFEEFHYEKAYSIEAVSRLLEKSGLKLLGVYDELSFNEPKEDSQRIYFIAQEVKKLQNNVI